MDDPGSHAFVGHLDAGPQCNGDKTPRAADRVALEARGAALSMTAALALVRKALRLARSYASRGFSRKAFIPPPVPALSIETTNICNSRCGFCANRAMTRRRLPLPMNLFTKAVDEFAAMGGTSIDFNVTIGDPLLDPQLLERARYVEKFPQFRSNGFITTLQWLHLFDLDEFCTVGFTWLAISTTLSGPEKYREFFGVDKYDQMLANLVRLLKHDFARRTLGVYIDVKPTDEPVEAVLRHPDYVMIKELSGEDLDARVRARSFYVDDWTGAVSLPAYLRKRPLYPRPFLPCRLLYKGLMVYSNGNVGACSCRDYDANSGLILGNLERETLGEMWSGAKLAAIRKDWRTRNRVPAICQSCRHYLY